MEKAPSSANKIFLSQLEAHDLTWFKAKWDTASPEEQQAMIRQQRDCFTMLLADLQSKPDYQPELFIRLAKAACITPLAPPYLLQLLKFIDKQNAQVRASYYAIMKNFLPEFSSLDIRFTIKTLENQTYLCYNDKALECFLLSNLIELKIISERNSGEADFLESIASFIRKASNLGMNVADLTITLEERQTIAFTMTLHNPTAKISFKNQNITIELEAPRELLR